MVQKKQSIPRVLIVQYTSMEASLKKRLISKTMRSSRNKELFITLMLGVFLKNRLISRQKQRAIYTLMFTTKQRAIYTLDAHPSNKELFIHLMFTTIQRAIYTLDAHPSNKELFIHLMLTHQTKSYIYTLDAHPSNKELFIHLMLTHQTWSYLYT